jgi:peptide/nickel transport system ATP-binding protein
LSGGLRQRALIAAAIAGQPRLLIADEPTTALDMTVQAGILRLLASLTADGMGLLLISHDLGVVARLADRVLVMRGGAVVDEGSASTILGGGAHPYARALVAAVPSGRPRGTALLGGSTPVDSALQTLDGASGTTPRASDQSPPLVEAVGVSRTFGTGTGAVAAVREVSLRVEPGETLGIVGESGSGKTTLGRLLLALERPDSGHVLLDGEPWSDGSERSRRARRRSLGLVSQDTLGALDPRRDVEQVIGDALPRTVVGSERRERVLELMADVGLAPELLHRAPSTLSGGQRQRVGIARALGAEPRLLVLDEPVSALDATVAAGVLDLLDDVQRRRGFAFVFISHDLGVVRHMSDRVAVMLDGRIVEQGPAETVFGSPRHEYTRRLISDVPSLPLG